MKTRRRLLAALRWLALAPALLALAPVAAQAADLRQGDEVTTACPDGAGHGTARLTTAEGATAGSPPRLGG
jgi:hypothetical protein